ncbi:uncharacterized protein [Littorina saxatilis]|uniref:Asl1-like glycosyl hydrolase catalytic domain-containing protein n=1 Tax=Littorina saxatilis TaxID=31220 RepID=A0AAN9BJY8_9CAEN
MIYRVVVCALAVCYLSNTADSSKKKGVTLTRWNLLCHDFAVYRNKVAWWYDWEDYPDYWDTMKGSCGPLLENRAAMVWGWRSEDRTIRIPHDATVVLGYNEPNHHEQANLTAREAALHWPDIQKAAGSRTLVGPSPTNCGPPSCDQDVWPWMDEFLQNCPQCRLDYVATHLYWCDPHREMAFLQRLYDRYHKKIWITEFACPYKQSLEDQLNYMKTILPLLEASPIVYRYSWFISRWEGDWFIAQNASLLHQHSSTPTPLGQYYLNF